VDYLAEGEKEQTEVAEITLAEVGDVPAQVIFDDLAYPRSFFRPIIGCPVGKGRQVKSLLADKLVLLLSLISDRFMISLHRKKLGV
jgi:hypothetical protein